MALSDYYSAAATAAANATDRESARLRAVAEQNQMAANAVQQQLMQQRLLSQTGAGVKPRSTTPTATPELPGVQTVGGPVVDRPIKSAPAPMPAAGLRTGPSGAAITPNMQAAISAVPSNIPPLKAAPPPAPTAAGTGVLTPEQVGPIANNIAFGRGWLPQPNQLPIEAIDPNSPQFSQMYQAGKNEYRMDKRLAVLGSDVRGYPELAGAWNFFAGSPQQAEVIDYRAKAGSWLMSNDALEIVKANPALLDEAERDPIDFYKKYGPEGAGAPAAAQPAATATPTTAAEQPAATTAGVIPPATATGAETETAAAEQPAGLEPPAPAPEPGVPEVLTNPRLRAAIPDAALDYQSQRLAADRQDLLNFYNRQAEQIRASAAAADQRRNAQYENLVVQAREAATAGNTGYAQTLMNQADAILAEAETSAQTVQQSMDKLWVDAREAMATNEADILSNQAVIAEREFSQFNNPSRMLTMMEAYGFQGAELEDAGGGKFRLRMPSTEPGQFFYVQDSSGKPASFTKQSFSEYFMSTISEDFRIKAQERQAAAAQTQSEREWKLIEIDAQMRADITKELAKDNATPGEYTWTESSDGSLIGQPKYAGRDPVRIVTKSQEADQPTTYNTIVIR